MVEGKKDNSLLENLVDRGKEVDFKFM